MYLQIQGAFIGSSLVEIFLGVSGLTGVLIRFVGPVCICPTIMLSGMALFKTASRICSKHWGISGMQVVWILFLLIKTYTDLRIIAPFWHNLFESLYLFAGPLFWLSFFHNIFKKLKCRYQLCRGTKSVQGKKYPYLDIFQWVRDIMFLVRFVYHYIFRVASHLSVCDIACKQHLFDFPCYIHETRQIGFDGLWSCAL